MKILVTGHNGFIGTALIKALKSGLFANHHAILDDADIVTLPCDVREIDVENVKLKVDRIYHLAGTPSPAKYKINPTKVLMSSIQGTYKVLELAKKCGARVLFTSTINTDAYYPSRNSRSCYVDGKKVAEDLCYLYSNEVDVRVARLFSTYGVGMKLDDGRVIPNFIVKALKNEEITIFGDGTQVDSFCYINDMVQALHSFMETEDNPNRPIELGNALVTGAKGITTIKDLADQIVELCESKSSINYVSFSGLDKERIPNVAYASKILKWTPGVSLSAGLKETIYSFREAML
jgi:UDP-glucuronate decarboxylase